MTCRLFHDWSKWEDIVMLIRQAGGSEQAVDFQKSVCKRCGKKKVRQIV